MGEVSLSIQAQEGLAVTAIREMPDGAAATGVFVYAPGAGSNIDDPFGSYLSRRLVESDLASVPFQFPYMEAGKRRGPIHLSCWKRHGGR